ncbi:MAG: VacJ family lipoprotein [Leptospiraceae bacterium]|nr:VacJ family lipoprotein [Leptospiraceae bacterium]
MAELQPHSVVSRFPLIILLLGLFTTVACSSADKKNAASKPEQTGLTTTQADADEMEGELIISDPWEGFNRAIFSFNNVFFKYMLQPIARGWNFIIPGFLRQGIHNFFNWAYTPGRLVSNLLQAKVKGAGKEIVQFAINGTVGVLGFYNASREIFSLEQTNEDFDQVLGKWGVPEGPYVVWPFIGSYTARGTFGFAGDVLMQPQMVIVPAYVEPETLMANVGIVVGVYSTRAINRVSLDPDEYDNLIKDSIDPYVFIRDIYLQNTRKNVAD